MSVSQVIDQQDNIVELLTKAQTNLKKSPKSRLTPGYVETRTKCIEEYWSNFRIGHTNLFKLTTKEQRAELPYFTKDLHSHCEELFSSLKADLVDLLHTLTAPSTSNNDTNASFSSIRSDKVAAAEVKLPRIELPKYSGAYDEWQSFEDTFTSLISSNKSLSNVQKLHYLKSCVLGEAKNCIKHFQVTDKNFQAAWDTLKNRYSHKRLIVNAILKRLFSIKKITQQSSSQLKSLIDNTKECINSLNNMDINTDSWDPIIIFLTVQKLDQESHKGWECFVSSECNETPAFHNLTSYLENTICTMELTISTSLQTKVKERTYHTTADITAAATTTATSSPPNCIICNEEHLLCHCKEFGKWSPEKRSEYVIEQRLCFNCLGRGHSVYYCRQKTTCRICHKRHHSLLHSFNNKQNEKSSDKEDIKKNISTLHIGSEELETEENVSVASHYCSKSQRALLATALIIVKCSSGQGIVLRALIDMGSQASFISERATQTLNITKKPIHGTVTGVGSTSTTVRHVVQLEVLSRYEENFRLPVKAYVISTHLTSHLPCKELNSSDWPHIDGLVLADPNYFTPGKIDILLGIDVYTEIIKNNLIKGPPGTPCAQETNLGWILFGNICDSHSDENSIVLHHHLDIDMDNMLRNMWEIDQSIQRIHTAEEKLCEEIYATTHSRTPDGRYMVKLPFKHEDPISLIGDTKNIALKRFYQLERKLEANRKLKEEYTQVMEEYLQLKHMEEVPEEEKNKPAIYLPHHAVIRDDKETSKLRIVFDASCKGVNNKSLNDELLVGPQLQKDLRNLIMKWRLKPICFLTDIQKMYRQIHVTKSDADCQRILWRKDKTEQVKEYRLLRVTFGTASAPYLAVRTLVQLAEDEGVQKIKTRAAQIISEDFFVDDCMSGCETVEEAIGVSKELTDVMHNGGFELQKWASNSSEFIDEIHPSMKSACANKDIPGERLIKTLGLTWNISSDAFQYNFNLPEIPKIITKRNILADIQRLFDPLGWLGAAIIPAKILIQKLWIEQFGWDEKVSDALKEEWLILRKSFEHLNKIVIKRWLHTSTSNTNSVSLHGFCDASNRGYCAVVYCRSENKDGEIKTAIVASKTRVAPVKPVSIPRLELLGAVLLAKLLTQVRDAMKIPINQVFAWTDSSVVLSWLLGDPNRWKPFVSNRVIEILDNTCNTQWFLVASKENPADIGSRGINLEQLIETKLWWEGPEWLKEEDIKFSKPNVISTDIERKKMILVNTVIDVKNKVNEGINFEGFDTLQELKRVIVFCKRFINSKRKPEKLDSTITTEELEDALITCIRRVQEKEYKEEINRLKENRNVWKSSHLKSLNPYLDDRNILRVGGRLRNSDLQDEKKHPIILGTKNDLTPLIIADAHQKTLHGGIQLMLSFLRTKYWIIRAKNAVKAYVHKCVICARHRAVARTQVMGDLPKVRTTPARPFLHSGVDFAGPLQVLISRGRGSKTKKAYIAIFICMATKAVHLELVGDLTSESFVGAFRRFTARRGKCAHLWSDQGRNFVGANKELAAAWAEAKLELPGHLVEELAADSTQWHFIPPYSPNFGGLWEAGVKSIKFHLKRILTSNLTFEELTTTLCQIESCLNSRPLTPLESSDPDAIEPLTPGHFLIGESPFTTPCPDLRLVKISNLSRWQLTQRLVRDFWHRWQQEYLSRLQERPKWLKRQPEFNEGDVVIIKEDQLPPGKWSLGRVVEKHPGPDGITRVYSVKCRNDTTKRSVSKLCALPINEN